MQPWREYKVTEEQILNYLNNSSWKLIDNKWYHYGRRELKELSIPALAEALNINEISAVYTVLNMYDTSRDSLAQTHCASCLIPLMITPLYRHDLVLEEYNACEHFKYKCPKCNDENIARYCDRCYKTTSTIPEFTNDTCFYCLGTEPIIGIDNNGNRYEVDSIKDIFRLHVYMEHIDIYCRGICLIHLTVEHFP